MVFPDYRGRKGFTFYTVNSFNATKSWKQLTDNSEVKVAKKLYFDELGQVYKLIQAGDPVELWSGYDGDYNLDFTGFVSFVNDTMPVVLQMESPMWLMKRTPVNVSYSSINLQQLLKNIVPSNYEIDAYDIELGSVFLPKMTVAGVLTLLKDQKGLYSYFDGNKLICGKIYSDNTHAKVYTLDLLKDCITNNLEYRSKDQIKIRVTMTSYNAKGKKKVVHVGDKDGEEQKLVCTNVTDETVLLALATKTLDRLKFDGYQGTILIFGNIPIKIGDIINLTSDEWPERAGHYYVDNVDPNCDENGGLRKLLTLGPKAA
ncbi:MAG TPA: hypothetical protein VN698_12390 [Bacteroidia bacterium]|nr:hypothetical protein [Bacteroidia bacterium]